MRQDGDSANRVNVKKRPKGRQEGNKEGQRRLSGPDCICQDKAGGETATTAAASGRCARLITSEFPASSRRLSQQKGGRGLLRSDPQLPRPIIAQTPLAGFWEERVIVVVVAGGGGGLHNALSAPPPSSLRFASLSAFCHAARFHERQSRRVPFPR